MRRVAALSAATLVVGLYLLPSAALADTGTSNMAASATVASAASVTAAPLNFGNYIGQAVNQTSAITVTGTNGTSYSVSIDQGQGTGAGLNSRKMTKSGGTSTLDYQLYTSSARTAVWGNGTAGTATVSGTSTGVQQTLNVFGTIPANQTPLIGSYSDTLVVTVTY